MVKSGHSITGYTRVTDVHKMDMAVLAPGKDLIEDTSRELTLLTEPKEDSDVFGEPEVTPRVGEEYQVSLPEQVSRSEYEEQLRSEVKEGYIKRAESGPDNHEHDPVSSEEKIRSALNGKGSDRSGSFPVPHSSYEPLSKTEEDIFLLGLYIFGRDFAKVKSFVGSRNIGKILSYYYGKFYKSQRYKRWIGCKKLRGRRCGCGQKLFIGLRQQELLSRLLPQLPEEGKNKLLEVSKTFSEGNVLLEEYVTTLKDVVGLENLVKAVGIGEGKKHDLTRMLLEKSSRAAHLHPLWPPKKGCAAFSREDILNFLQGGGRLSKAQSNDLFWEAVWPRLLAKGWHSEQPANSLFSKEYFVFLVPGVTKFSRRKLVKGHHYFDSVRDVLTKVASDPSILDLRDESGEGYTVEEMNRDRENSPNQGEGYTGEEMNLDRERSPNQDHRCYLKPRTKSQDLKFTVVDTTVGNGETRRLREVRDLPVEVNYAAPGSRLVEDERNSIEVEKIARDPTGESNYLSFNMVEADMFNPVNVISFDKKETPANDKSVGDSLNRGDDRKGTTQCRQKPRKKPDENSLAPELRKRRKMKICSDKQMGSCTEIVGEPMKPELEKEETNCCPATNIPEKKKSVPVGENETDHKPRRMLLIDLNLMPEPETTEPENVEMPTEQHNQVSQLDGVTAAPSADPEPTNSEMQPSGNSRRQSGRTRVMSTRALEALASGLMVMETKWKR